MSSAAPPPPSTPNLVSLINRYAPAQASILQHLEIRDIIALSRVCLELRHVYSTTIKTQYNINAVLARLFASPIEFRNVQAETDAIICNSSALYFFLRSPFTEGIMIYIRKGSSFTRMQAYLEDDGWSETREPIVRDQDEDEFYSFAKHIHSCSEKGRKEEPGACPRLYIKATYESALFTAIEDAAVTEALNLITWSHAYSLLPYPTFILRRSFLLEPAVDGELQRLGLDLRLKKNILDLPTEPVDIRDAQNGRAYRISAPEPHIVLASRIDYGHRRLGDKHTWTIALNTDGIRQPTQSTIPTTYASFRILPQVHPSPKEDSAGRFQHTPSHYKLLINIIAAPCLKHEYLVDPTDHRNPAHIVVSRRYQDISLMQIEALEDEERPLGLTLTGLGDMRRRWEALGCEVPERWKWYDDEVEELLRARWDGGSE